MSNNRGSYDSNSYSGWPGTQRDASQQFLTPEDMYNLSSGGSQYGSSARSYPASRHSSESYSPSYSSSGSVSYQQPSHTQVAPSSNPQRASYHPPTRHAAESGVMQSYGTTTPPGGYNTSPRHASYSGGNPYDSRYQTPAAGGRQSDNTGKDKDKGKEPARRSPDKKSSGSDRHSGGERHGGGASGGRKAGPALPPGEKLVSGVFIRY